MEKKIPKNVTAQINRLREIATFGVTQWRESPSAAVKIFSSGKGTVSFLSVGVLREFNSITSSLYSQNQIILNNYTLKNFIQELVSLIRDLKKEDRIAIKEDWNTLIRRLSEKPDVQTEIAVPIYGVVLDIPFIKLGDFKIYKQEALKKKYSKNSNPVKSAIDSEYYLAQTVTAKSLDKCREDAEKIFFIFENVANFITAGFHKTYKISLFNNWFSAQINHLAFTENQILEGGKTLHNFEPVKIENLHFVDELNGYGKVWKLITSKKNDLQTKILESIEWSGMASVETDDNKALLLYLIAIESILNYAEKTSLYVPVTVSLADSVAFLLGKNKKSRKEYSRYIFDLYALRSAIVHGSRQKTITELHLHTAFSLSHQIIRKILTEEPYQSFQSKKELSHYLLREKKYDTGGLYDTE